jgi:peptidoglycan/xylan/chitin deacetylase (PgdA/CDA1 family)
MTLLPLTIGTTHGVRVEVTKPIPDLLPPDPAERVRCTIELEGENLGVLELPVFDGLVPSYVLADAIAAEFGWQILDRFFQRRVYRDLEIKRTANGLSIWRDALCLAGGINESEDTLVRHIHDHVGWTIFLQELWGRPDWPQDRFYNPEAVKRSVLLRKINNGWLTIEVSEELPDVDVSGQELNVVLSVGGVALGVVTVPVARDVLHAQELRAALTRASGFELCRAAVREGLLGQPMTEPMSLRDRLAVAAARAAQRSPGGLAPEVSVNVAHAPGWLRAFSRALSPGEHGVVLARRVHDSMDTSTSRRAMLPASAAGELLDAASIAGEPVIYVPRLCRQPKHVVYAPDLIWHSLTHKPSSDPGKTCRNGDAQAKVTERLPILIYHRVARTGSIAMSRYRVATEMFEEQLCYLRNAGFYSVSLEDWRAAMAAHRPLPGRAVLITFDDGYRDFLTCAWPLLKRYGFSATVFLVADEIGRSNNWDRAYGEEASLLGWNEIRQLQNEGIEFGSHSASHRSLTSLSFTEVVREGARSRAILQRGLGVPIKAFAYPFGDEDRVVQHLIGACGYIFGLTCRPGLSGLWDPLLALPRIEITGSDSARDFVTKLNSGTAAVTN